MYVPILNLIVWGLFCANAGILGYIFFREPDPLYKLLFLFFQAVLGIMLIGLSDNSNNNIQPKHELKIVNKGN